MSDISKIDKNFAVKNVDENGFKWYDSTEDVFSVFGLFHDEKGYFRVPDDVGERTSNGVAKLARHTCGGRIVFETNSRKIAIDIKGKQDKMAHFPLTGSVGLDLYIDKGNGFEYFMTFVPPFNCENVYFIDGVKMFDGEFRDCATVDGVHPNDYGFVRMAEAVLKVIKEC